MGRRFENTLDCEIEYLFNGGSDPHDPGVSLVRAVSGASPQAGRHLVGLTANYEFLPIAVGQLAVIRSLSDSSFLLQPTVTISLSDEMTAIAGFTLNRGARPDTSAPGLDGVRSEFGSYPDVCFVQWKWYF
ncbi:hypothetical protein ACFL0Q_06760 [Thermodesulfobacteriota bacterium]